MPADVNTILVSQELQDIIRVSGVKAKGYGILPKFAMLDKDLSIEAKAIYAYFCSHTGGGSGVFPSRDKILADLLLSKSGYYKHFPMLTEQGYITVQQERGQRFMRNVYTVESNPKKFEDDTGDHGQQEAYSKIKFSGLESMGFGMIPKAVMIDTRLSLKAKGIYAYFCTFTGSGQAAFPKRDNILFHLNISHPTYYKNYNSLLDFNLITVVQKHINGRLSHNDYYLNDNPDIEQSARTRITSEQIQCEKIQDTEKQDTESGISPLQCERIQDAEIQDAEIQYAEKQDNNNNNSTITNLTITNPSIMQAAPPPVPAVQPFDGMSDIDLEFFVMEEMQREKALPYPYLSDERRLTAAIHVLTEYRRHADWLDSAPADVRAERADFRFSVFRLFNEALIAMLSTREQMTLKGAIVTYAKVYERLKEYVVYEPGGAYGHEFIYLGGLLETATRDFENACAQTEIKNHLQYMKACIWNAMLVGDIGIQADLKFSLG